MYYGNAAATNQEDVSGTWNSNYKIVTHLHSDTADSTSNNNDGTNNGATLGTGKIANAHSFDGVNDDVSFADKPSLDLGAAGTLSIWLRSTDTLAGHEFAVYWDDSPFDIWGIYADRYTDQFRGFFKDISNALIGGNAASTTNVNTAWHYVVVSYDGTALRLYVDSVLENTKTAAGKTINSITNTGYLGKYLTSTPTNRWQGDLDEFRVSNTARSAQWIQTEYNNQNNPGTFYTVGAEEMQ